MTYLRSAELSACSIDLRFPLKNSAAGLFFVCRKCDMRLSYVASRQALVPRIEIPGTKARGIGRAA